MELGVDKLLLSNLCVFMTEACWHTVIAFSTIAMAYTPLFSTPGYEQPFLHEDVCRTMRQFSDILFDSYTATSTRSVRHEIPVDIGRQEQVCPNSMLLRIFVEIGWLAIHLRCI